MRVRINTPRGEPIEGYTFDESRAFSGDSLAWRNGRKLNALRGKAIQVAVELDNARLYAMRGNFQTLSPREWTGLEETGEAPQPRSGF